MDFQYDSYFLKYLNNLQPPLQLFLPQARK